MKYRFYKHLHIINNFQMKIYEVMINNNEKKKKKKSLFVLFTFLELFLKDKSLLSLSFKFILTSFFDLGLLLCLDNNTPYVCMTLYSCKR